MLLWLVKGPTSKIRTFRFRIFIVSFVLHLVLLFFILFISFDETIKIQIRKSKNSAVPIVFLPFAKTVPGALNAIKNAGSKKINQAISSTKNKVSIQNDVAAKKVGTENSAKTAKIETKKPIITEDLVKQKSKPLQEIQKKEVELKAKEVQKNEAEKIEESKIAKALDKVEPKKEIKENIDQPLQEQICQDIPLQQEPIYVGTKDLDQMQIEEFIEHEIASHWRPPVGMSKKLKCQLSAYVDMDGKPQNITIKQSSKSIAFDMCAKRDLAKANFPKEFCGREFTIQFGPEEQ